MLTWYCSITICDTKLEVEVFAHRWRGLDSHSVSGPHGLLYSQCMFSMVFRCGIQLSESLIVVL